jgi:hypothetical protein
MRRNLLFKDFRDQSASPEVTVHLLYLPFTACHIYPQNIHYATTFICHEVLQREFFPIAQSCLLQSLPEPFMVEGHGLQIRVGTEFAHLAIDQDIHQRRLAGTNRFESAVEGWADIGR